MSSDSVKLIRKNYMLSGKDIMIKTMKNKVKSTEKEDLK